MNQLLRTAIKELRSLEALDLSQESGHKLIHTIDAACAVDQYFAAQRQGHVPGLIYNNLLAAFGRKGMAPLPVRDLRGKKWAIVTDGPTTRLVVNMGDSPCPFDLFSTTTYRNDRHQMATIVASQELDAALVILSNSLQEQIR